MTGVNLLMQAFACILSNTTVTDVSLLDVKKCDQVYEDYIGNNSTSVTIQVN